MKSRRRMAFPTAKTTPQCDYSRDLRLAEGRPPISRASLRPEIQAPNPSPPEMVDHRRRLCEICKYLFGFDGA
jgi:hypothetical protein